MTLLLIHAAATWFMVGLIWFVQVVHYPLMAKTHSDYEQAHIQRTTWVVGPAMFLEAFSGTLLLAFRPATVPLELVIAGVGLLLLIGASTRWFQVPCHERLCQGFDATTHQRLVRTNWLRTMLWTVRGVLVLLMCEMTMNMIQ